MKSLIFLTFAVVTAAGCSTVLVSHVRSTDYETPGVRYFLPAPYLLVKSAVELSRTETIYAMSPIDKTVLRMVVPCDDRQTPCKPVEGQAVPVPPLPPPPGSLPVRPGVGAQAGADGSDAGGSNDRWGGDAGEGKAAKEDSAAATSIVWLPDYCQQYTIIEKDHVGSQKVQIQLADGWKISALNTEVNNSEVFQKMIDALSNIAGASINPTGKAAAAGVQAASSATSGAQGGRTRLFRRIHTVTLKPGLYQLLQYPQTRDNEPDCSKQPSFRPPRDAIQPSETWAEIDGSRDGAGQPAIVEPGRLANPGKPAR